MKTFREFVGTNEHLSENVFDQIKNAATMFRYMTNPKSFPKPTPSGPANLSGVYKGSSTPTPKPTRFQIGTPKAKPVKPVARGNGSPISAVVQALTNLQGDTPQTRSPQQIRDREAAIQKRWGTEMNQTPSRFGKANPDVPATASKPAEPKVEPKVQPRSVTTERPKPKPTGPVTSAQAIASGSKEGQGPKSVVSTYRDKADTKGLSVGRYKTLAQHRAEVAKSAAQNNKK